MGMVWESYGHIAGIIIWGGWGRGLGGIWGHLKASGKHPEASGGIWEHLEGTGGMWEASGGIWMNLEAFGSGGIWRHLDMGRIWEGYGEIWGDRGDVEGYG